MAAQYQIIPREARKISGSMVTCEAFGSPTCLYPTFSVGRVSFIISHIV